MGKKARRNEARHEDQAELKRWMRIATVRLKGTAYYGLGPPKEPKFYQGGLPGQGKRK